MAGTSELVLKAANLTPQLREILKRTPDTYNTSFNLTHARNLYQIRPNTRGHFYSITRKYHVHVPMKVACSRNAKAEIMIWPTWCSKIYRKDKTYWISLLEISLSKILCRLANLKLKICAGHAKSRIILQQMNTVCSIPCFNYSIYESAGAAAAKTFFSSSILASSPLWCIATTMSQPPTNSFST